MSTHCVLNAYKEEIAGGYKNIALNSLTMTMEKELVTALKRNYCRL